MENKYEVPSIRYKVSSRLLWCILLSTLYLLPGTSFSQSSYTRYWIQFTDKNNSPYSVSNPSAFLSSRAILRRTVQGISVKQNDLPVNPAYYDSIKNVPNVTIINRSRWFNAVTISTTDTNALNKIATFPFVSTTKPVGRLKSANNEVELNPKSQILNPKSHILNPLSYNYGPSQNQISMLNGVCMHNAGFDGKGMIIAVLDAGFYNVDSLQMFDSLRANGQILGTWDFVENDAQVYDSHTHGTMVLSTMGGNVPGMLVGTAPKAKYWLLKTEEGATELVIEEDNWVSGAEFADSVGADIITTSLGYNTYDSVIVNGNTVVNPDNHTYAHMDGNTCRISIGADIAVSKGMFTVSSAGNSGGSPWNFIGAPADADSILAVGAVDSMKNYAWFSSNGPSYDGRVKPNVAAQGQDAVVARPDSIGYYHLSGTSFAAPITAGMVACLWQAHPTSKVMDIFNAIEQSASMYATPDTLYGHGIPDFCKASSLLSVEEPNRPTDQVLTIFPNPSSSSTLVSIYGVNAYGLALDVVDAQGKLAHKEILKAQTATLDLRSLAKGVYTVQLKNGDRSYYAKLAKY